MKALFLLNAVMNMPQWVIFVVCVLGAVLLLLVFGYFLYLLLFNSELKAEVKIRTKAFKDEAKQIQIENKRNIAELKRSTKEIDEKAQKASLIESEFAKMQAELISQDIEEERAREISYMTLTQLQTLKNKEMTDMSGAYIINAITRRVLIDSEFERREDVEDFKVPVNKTTYVSFDTIEKRLLNIADVTKKEGIGKRPDIYKVANRTIAFLYNLGDGRFQLKFKCGPYYGQRLNGLYPEFIARASFPCEMMWFIIENKGEYSMELIDLLIDISYNIAKAGF